MYKILIIKGNRQNKYVLLKIRIESKRNDPLGLILKRGAPTLTVVSSFFSKMTLQYVACGKVRILFFAGKLSKFGHV